MIVISPSVAFVAPEGLMRKEKRGRKGKVSSAFCERRVGNSDEVLHAPDDRFFFQNPMQCVER